jgi:signal transduction histidine kinase
MGWLNSERLKKEIPLSLFFGILSLLLGLIQFQIPGSSGVSTDLREIPLLISVFYLGSPFSFLIISALTALAALTMEGAHYSTSFLIHFIPLLIAMQFYSTLKTKELKASWKGVSWGFFTIAYYCLGLIPIGTIIEILFFNFPLGFVEDYTTTIFNLKFEMMSSTLVSSLYLVQFEVSATLKKTNENLEVIVDSRTQELRLANSQWQLLNQKLISSNEKILALNENLEKMVDARTAKIKVHLNQLESYASMNSHEVRAPVARILGLINLINMEEDGLQKNDLIQKLNSTTQELDAVIKKMNLLLEAESFYDSLKN